MSHRLCTHLLLAMKQVQGVQMSVGGYKRAWGGYEHSRGSSGGYASFIPCPFPLPLSPIFFLKILYY